MEKVSFWTVLGTLAAVGALIVSVTQNHFSSRQNVKEAQDERRSNAESSMSGVLSSVIRTLQWYVTVDASPGPKLERDSMDEKELMALTDVDRSLEAFDIRLEKNSLELDVRDLQVCKSFREQAEGCRKLRRLAQVQRQDWFITIEQIRKHPSDSIPTQLKNLTDWHLSMAEDYARQSRDYFDTAKVEADVLLGRWKSRRNSVGGR